LAFFYEKQGSVSGRPDNAHHLILRRIGYGWYQLGYHLRYLTGVDCVICLGRWP